ncbi:uncharacterized protein N7479_005894 [Penicillium vulpinum]|uniref:Uncharacterized protein n=1 Tax=Penicillium vulpinum TaxID=29845 RepID=A0A1V6SF64_9EURO|nr:uncharacterized protein N7479_005894 [Penicillium vulpinum]KAJ5958744.1 hypothetical protein N7479_005894 [Penicillium vulpinum]OQE12566.1 hypothetical protein PENVUL_c001G04037 [Penicillium vulpinum]
MGFISTLARCVRIKRLSKRLSTTSTKRHDEDSNDLIKTNSETASLARASMDSTSTMVHHTLHEPVLPSESPANRMEIRPDTGNVRTLFDEDATSTSHSSERTVGRPAYPILKLDCRSPVEAPRRVVQGPLDMGDEVKGGGTTAQRGFLPQKCEKKDRESVTAMLKRHCGLNIPRSSVSIKTSSRSLTSPKWLDSTGITEEERLVDKQDEKWVEAGLQGAEKRRDSAWGSIGFGRMR